MPYKYVAYDAEKKLVKGTVPVSTESLAVDTLVKSGLKILSLKEVKPRGLGRIPTLVFSVKPEGSRMVFEVKDNGTGMDRETRENLFTLFFSSKGNRGTGLGLFIAKKIITQHGGQIKVESKPNRGSSFRIIIPRQHSAPTKRPSR